MLKTEGDRQIIDAQTGGQRRRDISLYTDNWITRFRIKKKKKKAKNIQNESKESSPLTLKECAGLLREFVRNSK